MSTVPDPHPPAQDQIESDTGPFAIIPEWVLDHPELNAAAVRLYGVLARYADNRMASFPFQKTLAARLHSTVRTVQRSQDALVRAGALTVERQQRKDGSYTSNLYTLRRLSPIRHSCQGDTTSMSQPEREPYNETASLRSEQGDKSRLASLTGTSARWGWRKKEWLRFLEELDSSRSAGVLSPVDNPEAYAVAAARSRSSPPADVNIPLLQYVTCAIKEGLGRKNLRLPAISELEEASRWYSQLDAMVPDTALPNLKVAAFLRWAAPLGVKKGGMLRDPKQVVYGLTQDGVLSLRREEWEEWQERQGQRALDS